VLTISLDGRAEDQGRLRRALPGVPDSHAHVMELLPRLLRMPRVVVTQTIAPGTAAAAAQNFEYLLGLGLWRFNLLPGYFIPWTRAQLEALERGLDAIALQVRERWAHGERLYIRNLFTRAPTPFFNTGLVVDADRTIHASNVGLSSALEPLLALTRTGSLDEPPSLEALAQKAEQVNGLIERQVPAQVWRSTLAVDALLSRFCTQLYPDFAAQRRRRREAA
jgi:hypothetical protein